MCLQSVGITIVFQQVEFKFIATNYILSVVDYDMKAMNIKRWTNEADRNKQIKISL